ncbi:MAG: dockerin type I repeat-containing protein, partial [Candidatus Omnitrophota bacterium]
MRKLSTCVVILLMVIFTVSLSLQSAQIEWYVAITGKDAVGYGKSAGCPFQTIQHAIDAASDGDIIIVMEGRYTGSGNKNLNFKGKAITLRSWNPEDNQCIQKTIIDAEKQGVIVRFINDEGPATVFVGFTLKGGDTSISVRGVPGFFEFSENANPTTKRLSIEKENPAVSSRRKSVELLSKQTSTERVLFYDKQAGTGNNPFHQPVATTDYYGSGDVNGDGKLNSEDVVLAEDMADFRTIPCIRADVDGNGTVNLQDVAFINKALSGDILPGWWNDLAGREKRTSWVNKFLALDQTDRHPYKPWWVCHSFCLQTYFHGAFFRGDLSGTRFDGGQTVFNVPIYVVVVISDNFGHGINAILVGDNPLNFEDWFFIEPQEDMKTYPGNWNMPYNNKVCIVIPSYLNFRGGSFGSDDKVVFYVDETGWKLIEYSPDLILKRSLPAKNSYQNLPDLWNPRIIPIDSGMMLFERCREDLSRMTDIHLANLPFVDPPAGSPLVQSSQYSRLLDAFQEADGTIHLLWHGKDGYIPGVFYGKFNSSSGKLMDITRVSEGERQIGMGRIVVTSKGEIHVFWLENNPTYDTITYFCPPGIYWARCLGGQWETAQNLTPAMKSEPDIPNWEKGGKEYPVSLKYKFDVTVSKYGDIILVWREQIRQSHIILKQLSYNGEWNSLNEIENILSAKDGGVDLLTDYTGVMYLCYWVSEQEDERGNLLMRRSDDGSHWSEPEVIDFSGKACCPQMAAGDKDVVYLVWEKEVDGRIVPVWNKYESGKWLTARRLDVRQGANARYPTLNLLSDGKLVIAWSSRCPNRVTIETVTLKPPLPPIVTNREKYAIPNTYGSVQLEFRWTVPEGTKVDEFQYKITEGSVDGTVISDWKSAGLSGWVIAGVSSASLIDGKIYYCSVKAINTAGEAVGYSDGIIVDKTKPTGTIKIVEIINYLTYPSLQTEEKVVRLALSASDAVSGMLRGSQMCFSTDGSNWSAAESYAAAKLLKLP